MDRLLVVACSLLVASTASASAIRPHVQFDASGAGWSGPLEPCVNATSGETGRCMFAMDCFRARGRHVGVCTKGFYFGSCCSLPANSDLPRVPITIESNEIDGPLSPAYGSYSLDWMPSFWPDLIAGAYELGLNNLANAPPKQHQFPYSSFHAPSSTRKPTETTADPPSAPSSTPETNATTPTTVTPISTTQTYSTSSTISSSMSAPTPTTFKPFAANKTATLMTMTVTVARRPTVSTTIPGLTSGTSAAVTASTMQSTTSSPSSATNTTLELTTTTTPVPDTTKTRTTSLPTTTNASTSRPTTSSTSTTTPAPVGTPSNFTIIYANMSFTYDNGTGDVFIESENWLENEEPPTTTTASPSSFKPTVTPSPASSPTPPGNFSVIFFRNPAPISADVNPASVCGKPMYRWPKIVSGENARQGQWPWQVSVQEKTRRGYFHKCGASLLSKEWVITAAHCLNGVSPESLVVRMGGIDFASPDEKWIESRVQAFVHPRFSLKTQQNDLALLKLVTPLKVYGPNVLPICLPEADMTFEDGKSFVAGWGRLGERGLLPTKLQYVGVPIINNTECDRIYRPIGKDIARSEICAGYAEGIKDACEGDSGGPMMVYSRGRWFLAGVISWGVGCARANQPGVSMRVTEFLDWITTVTNDLDLSVDERQLPPTNATAPH